MKKLKKKMKKTIKKFEEKIGGDMNKKIYSPVIKTYFFFFLPFFPNNFLLFSFFEGLSLKRKLEETKLSLVLPVTLLFFCKTLLNFKKK